jgi:hypothetical protein
MMRKPCACPIRPSQGFSERFATDATPQFAAHIRNRIGNALLNDPNSAISYIRSRRETIPPGLDENKQGLHVRNRNHNMYQSQYVRHHLKADHRGKMMNSMMGRSDCDLYPQDC